VAPREWERIGERHELRLESERVRDIGHGVHAEGSASESPVGEMGATDSGFFVE
jgi:hypothetical protein